MTMRVFILTVFAALAALAAETPVTNSLVTSKRTPTADAPAFGTRTYFKKVWNQADTEGRVEGAGPARRFRSRR